MGDNVPLHIVTEDPKFSVGMADRFVILAWKTAVVMGGVESTRKAFDRFRAQHPDKKVGFLTFLEQPASFETPPNVRAGLAKMLKDYETSIGAAAIVYESLGFRATVVRSIVTAVNLASRPPFPSEVFRDLHSGASWLILRLGRDLETPKLIEHVTRLRQPST